MNRIVYLPPKLVRCKRCGTRYLYEAPCCTYPGMLKPISPRGFVGMIKVTLKTLLGQNKDGKFFIGFLGVYCPVCGEKIMA